MDCKSSNNLNTNNVDSYGVCWNCGKFEHFKCAKVDPQSKLSYQNGWLTYLCSECLLKNPEIALAQTNLPSISQTESAIACESIVRSTASEVATDIVEQVVDEVDSSIQRSENAIVEKFFKCNDCGINAISEKQLETHKRIKHGEVANFEYDDCQFLCNDKNN